MAGYMLIGIIQQKKDKQQTANKQTSTKIKSINFIILFYFMMEYYLK